MQLPPHCAGLLVSCDLQRKIQIYLVCSYEVQSSSTEGPLLARRMRTTAVHRGGMIQIARLVVCMLMIR